MKNSNVGKYLDLIQNAEPITAARLLAIVTAVILGYLDSVIHFSDDPLMTALAVTGVMGLVTWLWERGQVWSKQSADKVAAGAYEVGRIDQHNEAPFNPPAPEDIQHQGS